MGETDSPRLPAHLANRSERRKCCWMLSTREPRISSTTLKTRLKLSNCREVRGARTAQRLLTPQIVYGTRSLTYLSIQATDADL